MNVCSIVHERVYEMNFCDAVAKAYRTIHVHIHINTHARIRLRILQDIYKKKDRQHADKRRQLKKRLV